MRACVFNAEATTFLNEIPQLKLQLNSTLTISKINSVCEDRSFYFSFQVTRMIDFCKDPKKSQARATSPMTLFVAPSYESGYFTYGEICVKL